MFIFFDIDDTLCDSESAHLIALKKICCEFPGLNREFPDPVEQIWFEITSDYLNRYFENEISLEQQRILRIKALWKNRGLIISDNQARKIYDRYHYHFLQSCVLFPDTIACLRKMEKFKLGIISNGSTHDQLFKLKYNRIFSFFNPVLISESTGIAKPRKEIFQMAALRAGTAISDCIFIGNSYETDYLGSLNAGMHAIWLDRKNSLEHTGSEKISTLSELVNYPLLEN